jgi:UDP-glucose 4-epimerase
LKYLITGGAGFIGSHLAESLISREQEVIALDNLDTGNLKNLNNLIRSSNFRFVNGSILNQGLLEDLIPQVDHVLHFAAAVGVMRIIDKPLESLITNLRGTELILDISAKNRKEVLIASTSEVYGKNQSESLTEDSDRVIGSPLKSRWSYSEAKAIDESMAHFYFLEKELLVRIIRFFNIVGPRQVGNYGMVIPRMIDSALNNRPIEIYGSGTQTRCFCHIDDAVSGILSIIDSSKTIGEVYNLGNSQEISMNRLAEKIISLTNSKSTIKHLNYDEAYPKGFEDMLRRVPNISKIESQLGWSPRFDLDQIILDIVANKRSN